MKQESKNLRDDAKFLDLIDQQLLAQATRAVQAVLERRKPVLLADFVESLRGTLTPSPQRDSTQVVQEAWIGIESLSRLRSVVGGRFQNIKKKWMDAGFPLREHRGDRWKEFTLNQDAWLELASWIAKQGFEARLTPGSQEFLFELRSVARNS